jgi:hypothetical protein
LIHSSLIQEQGEKRWEISQRARLIHRHLDYARSAVKNLLDERIDQYQGSSISLRKNTRHDCLITRFTTRNTTTAPQKNTILSSERR